MPVICSCKWQPVLIRCVLHRVLLRTQFHRILSWPLDAVNRPMYQL